MVGAVSAGRSSPPSCRPASRALAVELEATRRVAAEREAGLAAEAARLTAELETTRRLADEQKAMLADAQAQLRETVCVAVARRPQGKPHRVRLSADALMQPVREALARVET